MDEKEREKVVGILGGMGPDATVDLFRKILRATPAKRDQDHLRIIIDCNSKIPDRTAHILGGEEDPGPYLINSAKLLERAGVDVIAIPCNTAHYWYERIQESVKCRVLNIMEVAAEYIASRWPEVTAAGLLATSSTVKVGLYHRACARKGIEIIAPDEMHQEMTTRAIHSVKAGDMGEAVRNLAAKAGEHLAQRGAGVVIAGCTEIPLILRDGDITVPVVDATRVLAEAVVRFARGTL